MFIFHTERVNFAFEDPDFIALDFLFFLTWADLKVALSFNPFYIDATASWLGDLIILEVARLLSFMIAIVGYFRKLVKPKTGAK